MFLSTGGGAGIGRAICQVMAREGASVAVTGTRLGPLQETVDMLTDIAAQNGHTNSTFKAFQMDVSSSEHVKAVMSSLDKEFPQGPPLSGVVNNAGITKDGPLVRMSEQAFDDVIRVNLKVSLLTVCVHVCVCLFVCIMCVCL